MDDDHIFQASGDSCPTCSAMDGQAVAPGYEPHPGCHCQTIPKKDKAECDVDIDLDFAEIGGTIIAGFSVQVICPDGSFGGGQEGELSHSAYYNDADFLEAAWGAAHGLADEMCAECEPVEEKPFNCC